MAYDNLSPEELAAKFGGVPVDSGLDLAALALKFGGRPAHPDPLTPMQGAQAVATGFNKSALAGIPGLPVKVALDLTDLARAAYGYAGSKLGVLSADNLPEPLQRENYVGSPEWIAKQINRAPVGSALIENPRPDSAAARVLNAGGSGMGGAVPANGGQAILQMLSGMSGQAATEAGAGPAASILASFGPQAALSGSAAATRGAFRGGEQGRQDMVDRVKAFNDAGVDPTVGLATGNRRTQAVEAALAKMPGGAGPIAAKIEAMQGQMQGATNALRDQISPVFGPIEAGDALKRGITDYRTRQQAIYGGLLDNALNRVPDNMRFPVDQTIARGQNTLADIPGAPNVSKVINQPLGFTQNVVDALRQDAAPKPAGQVPSPILQQNGQPFTTPTPARPGGLPLDAIRDLKTRIGAIAYQNNPLLADANQGALKSLYAGAKQDITNAGALADAQRVQNGQAPAVAAGLARADSFYAKSQQVLEDVLSPIYKAGDAASEKGFARVESDMRNSGQSVSRAMASLPQEVRRITAATVVDRLGRATPGQQNAEGTQFSPATFLTNWNRITPEAKSGILLGIPEGSQIRSKLDSIAQSASMMRDANKVYANPSGTTQAAALIGTGFSLGSGVMGLATGHPTVGLATMGSVLGSMAAARAGASMMTNPRFVNWLQQTTTITKPDQIGPHINRLAVTASVTKDPNERAQLEQFANDLQAELGQPQ